MVPSFAAIRRIKREEEDFHELMKTLRHPDQMYEKEYYFDEGLGMSLQEHIDTIKKNHPDVEVQTRRDRDGFAIIKTKFKPKYKYSLDEFVNSDA